LPAVVTPSVADFTLPAADYRRAVDEIFGDDEHRVPREDSPQDALLVPGEWEA
jgi:hypothetical protein